MIDEIRNTAKLVKAILEAHPITRGSDEYLYYEVCAAKLEQQGLRIMDFKLQDALLHRKMFDIPKFETVRRARQKLQADHPELASCTIVAEFRADREQAFREWARE